MMEGLNGNQNLKITLKTFFGLEGVLSQELVELGYDNPVTLNRAVQIQGSWKDVYRLNLHVSCAISILVEVATFKLKHADELYAKCMKIDWTKWFDLSKTFAVKGAVFSNLFSHSQLPLLKLKDAIADTFRNQFGERPNVQTKAPQVMFDLYINQDVVTVSLNTSGTPLFQRGYRTSTGEAPINEVVAAGLIRLSGWDKKQPFIDPFCGSGTLMIEAAFYATGIPSNIERQHFAFKNFKNFDAALWEEIQEAAKKRITGLPCEIMGSDINDEVITKARRNLRALPFGRFIETKIASYDELSKEGVFIITNPPYGERLKVDVSELYEGIGSWLKHAMSNSTCWIISSSEEGLKSVGLKPDKKIRLYNGELECSFRKYSVYTGSKKIKE